MPQINPHINFNGNALEAFEFYRSVFGGEFAKMVRFKDLGEAFPVEAHEAEKIMLISLPIGNNFLLGNDVPESMGHTNENENRSKISISADSKGDAIRFYNGLTEGGQIEVPMEVSETGHCFAMFRDKYGIEWILDFEPNA